MSKRERAEKTKGAAVQAKVVKTKEPEETTSIRDVGAFVAELAGLAGPDLLLAIRKVRQLGANAVFFFLRVCAKVAGSWFHSLVFAGLECPRSVHVWRGERQGTTTPCVCAH